MTLLPARRTRNGRGRALRLASVAALPLAAPVVVAPVADAATPAGRTTYVVQSGDTLSGIALRFGTDVATLVRLNRITDPDLVLAGTVLVVPTPVYRAPAPTPRAVTYTVKPGDTIWAIAAGTGTTVEALLAANDLDADARIRPGQVLALPAGAHLPSVPSAPRPKPQVPPAVHVVRPGETVSGIAAAVPHHGRGHRPRQQAGAGRRDHRRAEAAPAGRDRQADHGPSAAGHARVRRAARRHPLRHRARGPRAADDGDRAQPPQRVRRHLPRPAPAPPGAGADGPGVRADGRRRAPGLRRLRRPECRRRRTARRWPPVRRRVPRRS